MHYQRLAADGPPRGWPLNRGIRQDAVSFTCPWSRYRHGSNHLLVGVAGVTALLTHAVIRDFVAACVTSARVSTLIMGAVVLVQEKFAIEVVANAPYLLLTVGVPSALVAAVVGWLFRLLRKAGA
jgi:hypothetical protein